MNQVLAILWESYRMLKARILFWVVLGISVLVSGVFASIGITDEGYSILFGLFDVEADLVSSSSGNGELFYMVIFTNLIVKWWLGWFGIALALISCCSIFPEFLLAGSVDVAVSKPIGRIQLFLVKYMGSLLFVFLQVGVFCLIVFVALGLRMGHWNWSVFWAVPLLVFVFSLIYCVGVLVSVWSKSTLLSLLTMFLLWGGAWGIQLAEGMFYGLSYGAEELGVKMDMTTGEGSDLESGELDEMKKVYDGIKMVSWILPKTREVTLMVNQKIQLKTSGKTLAGMNLLAFLSDDSMAAFQSKENQKAAKRHSLFYIIGSSALFELIILSLACWKFYRRDY